MGKKNKENKEKKQKKAGYSYFAFFCEMIECACEASTALNGHVQQLRERATCARRPT